MSEISKVDDQGINPYYMGDVEAKEAEKKETAEAQQPAAQAKPTQETVAKLANVIIGLKAEVAKESSSSS